MSIKLIKHTFENHPDYKNRVTEVVSRAEKEDDKYVFWFQDYPVQFEFKEYQKHYQALYRGKKKQEKKK